MAAGKSGVVFGPLGHEPAKLAFQADLAGRRQAVDEQHAVEVVDLVLESARQQAVALPGVAGAVTDKGL
jgi:hypothetical protein